MNPKLRKLSRITLRVLAIQLALLAIGALALWSFRTDILHYAAKSYLEKLGIKDPQFTVTALTTSLLTVESIQIASPLASGTIQNLQVEFNLSQLIYDQHLKTLTITQAAIFIPIPEESPQPSDEQTPLPTLEDLVKLIDLSPYLPLPFERIQIVDSILKATFQDKQIDIALNATLTATSPESLTLEASLQRPQESLRLTTSISTPTASSIETAVHLESPLDSLTEFLPNWQELLPAQTSVTTGPIDLTLTLPPSGNDTPAIDVTLELQDLTYQDETTQARFHKATANTRFSSIENLPISLYLTPDFVNIDTLALDPDSDIELQLNLHDLTVVDFQAQQPIAWNYDSGFATGKSDISLRYDLSNERAPVSGKVITSDLSLDGTELLPVSIELTGSLENLSFTSSPISLVEQSEQLTSEGHGTLLIPELDSEPITLSYNAIAHSPTLYLGLENSNLPSFDLSLTTQTFETSTQVDIDLKSRPASTLISIPDTADLQGKLHLQIALTQDDFTELFTGELNLDASGISIQSNQLQGTGISATTKLLFRDLSTDLADIEDPLDPTFLNTLLNLTSTTIEWQAEQLTSDTANASWTGGSLSLTSDAGQILATTSFGSGIIAADTLRLEQVYIENEYRGTLDTLQGKSTVNAMLEGTPIELTSQHQINSPFTALSLTGEYTLTPTAFSHSDALARVSPSLTGLSFSAEIDAHGAFHATADSADASLIAHLRQGSVDYPSSKLTAEGLELDINLASLAHLDSGNTPSSISIQKILAGDAEATQAQTSFRLRNGSHLQIDSATVSLFGGQASLGSTEIPIDGSDFQGQLALNKLSLDQITRYIEFFDGTMDGRVSGSLPFRLRNGNFELLSGNLNLPDGEPANLHYNTTGFLTEDPTVGPQPKPTFSDRVLKFLKINPEKTAEQAIGNITITEFDATLFPDDSPDIPIRVRIGGIAHSDLGDLPIVINTQVHGSLSELYNFLIRLNSL